MLVVSAFDYRAPAELYASSSKTGKRPMRYTRFKSAAEAIKYAVEVLPPELLIGSTLEVKEERFDGFGIRAMLGDPRSFLRSRAERSLTSLGALPSLSETGSHLASSRIVEV